MALKLAKDIEAEFKSIPEIEIRFCEMHKNRQNIWEAFEAALKKLSNHDVCHITFCITGKLFETGTKPKRAAALAYLKKNIETKA